MATIHSLTYQPGPSEDRAPYQFNRVAVDSVRLIAGHGIEGDRKAGRNPKRQLNVMSLATLQALAREGWQIDPGEMGEQIVISGIDVAALEPGARLRLGDSAVIEINFSRTPCEWLAQIQDKNHEDAIGRVGVMASVIASGDVRVGDAVAILPAQVMR